MNGVVERLPLFCFSVVEVILSGVMALSGFPMRCGCRFRYNESGVLRKRTDVTWGFRKFNGGNKRRESPTAS